MFEMLLLMLLSILLVILLASTKTKAVPKDVGSRPPYRTFFLFGVSRYDLARIECTRKILNFCKTFLRATPHIRARALYVIEFFEKVTFLKNCVIFRLMQCARKLARTSNILWANVHIDSNQRPKILACANFFGVHKIMGCAKFRNEQQSLVV